jgi:hypothetical protein
MKNKMLFIILLSLISVITFAQEDTTAVEKVKDKPVRSPFESGYLIDAQTTVIPNANTLEMVIQHKFGTIENGRSDLWGVYAPANIRIALNYVAKRNFQIGAGITKAKMATDVNAKWTILEQTRENTIPIAVALYGVMAIDGRNISAFADSVSVASPVGEVNAFAFSDRLSYFSQLIIGRKFTDWLSLQTGLSFSHYNLTHYKRAGMQYDHDKIGVHFNGRIKVSPQGSIIFNYDVPLKIKEISEQAEWNDEFPHPKSNLSFGYEISTSTHAFQIYAGNAGSFLPQENMMWNQRSISKDNFAIGFTITRLWGF